LGELERPDGENFRQTAKSVSTAWKCFFIDERR